MSKFFEDMLNRMEQARRFMEGDHNIPVWFTKEELENLIEAMKYLKEEHDYMEERNDN